jgi:hypothetical protein
MPQSRKYKAVSSVFNRDGPAFLAKQGEQLGRVLAWATQ